ncbi:hypothetical protein FA15DRAFT_550649, partial [Coprinopsis marcescibilis]
DGMPKALASVGVTLIRKYENHVKKWKEAYMQGLDAWAAQKSVLETSSRKYASHRRV